MNPQTTEQNEKPGTEPSHEEPTDAPEPRVWDRALEFFNKYDKLVVGVCAIGVLLLTAVIAYAAIVRLGQGGSAGPPPEPPPPPPLSRSISVVAQAKPPGTGFWHGTLRILPRHGRIRLRVRVENTGSQPLTGLVIEAEPGEPLVAVPGKCWYRSRPCQGSISEGGVPVADLQPGKWTEVVFSVDVPSSIYGSTFPVRIRVDSEEKSAVSDSAEIVVSRSDAEEAVRPFVREVEAELSTAGKAPRVAKRSKRLLLGQWPTVTLEHPHPFGQIKQFRDEIEARPIRVDDLNFEHWLQGQVVSLRGVVLRRPVNDQPDDEDVIRQRVELGTPGGSTRLRCYIPRKPDHLFGRGDELEVKAVIVAWGPEGSSNADLTVAICPAARAVRRSRRP